MIVAHRGASHDAPENTFAAFELAWTQGADAIEGDFHLTRDHEIICHHDPTLGNRPISDLTLGEIHQFKPEAPMLREVLDTVPPGKKIFLEIKCGPEIIPFLLKQITGFEHQVTVIAFDPEVIQSVKNANPEIQANGLVKFRRPFPFTLKPALHEVLDILSQIGANGLGTHPQFVTKQIVQTLIQSGFSHHVWTVDTPKAARKFLSWGTSSITTNVPGIMKKQLEQKS